MNISKIRNVIRNSYWTRLDLSAHTREQFVSSDIPTRVGRHVEELKALEIPPHFLKETQRRHNELRSCEALIRRWQRLHGKQLSTACIQ